MPIYEYRCACGHVTEELRRIGERGTSAACEHCGSTASLVISRTHSPPDGVYSYAPNLGTEESFERKRNAIKEGIKVYPKEAPPREE